MRDGSAGEVMDDDLGMRREQFGDCLGDTFVIIKTFVHD
jgi:hypothetical protein